MENEILKTLNSEQRKAVAHGKGPLLIVAGAGTGKTTVITKRIAWLILNKKAKPEEILALTFTDKAASEMSERVDLLLPIGYFDLWISTFHSFCERVLKDWGTEIGLPVNFKILTPNDCAYLIRKNFDQFNFDYWRPLGNPTKFIREFIKHFSRAKDQAIAPENYLNWTENLKEETDTKMSSETETQEIKRFKELAEGYQIYQKLLLENNTLDFGDLINYTLKLFKERPNILEKYRQQFKYILVDEFQDTNWAQYELLKMLAEPRNNLTVVADDDQSVYKFRGASYNNVIQFKKDYPKAKEIVLSTNYRSKQNILDLAYQFIQANNPNRLEVQLKGKLTKKLKSSHLGQAEIANLHFSFQDEEASEVIKKIIDLKEKDRKANWNDFAILVRANSYGEIFVDSLKRQGIPYQFLAQSGLYTKPIILDILSYLKLLDNYHESPSVYRILTSPIFSQDFIVSEFQKTEIPTAPEQSSALDSDRHKNPIRPSTLHGAAHKGDSAERSEAYLENEDIVNLVYFAKKKNLSLYSALSQASLVNLSEKGQKASQKLINLIEKHTSISRQNPPSRIVFSFLEESGYLEILNKMSSEKEKIENIAYLNQFFKKITEFETTNPEPTLKNFNEYMEIARQIGEEGELEFDLEAGPEAVKIMTVHGAKGLEFKYVFIVNLVEQRFPSISRKEIIELPEDLIKEIIPQGDTHLQEERRLFYVAMTRAKDGLYFTSADSYGGKRKKKPSRFLFELGLEKIEEKKPKEVYLTYRPAAVSKEPKIIYRLPTKFSFSQTRAYEICPLQYKFAFVLKIPRRGHFTFSFGQTLHQVLYEFLKNWQRREQGQLFPALKPTYSATGIVARPYKTKIRNSKHEARNKFKIPNSNDQNVLNFKHLNLDIVPMAKPSRILDEIGISDFGFRISDLYTLYEKLWISEWYEGKQHEEKYRKLGKKILKNFYQDLIKNPPKIKYLEFKFNFKLGKNLIKGQIDRIDQKENNSLEIIDYKTGSFKEKLFPQDKEQLLIYQLAAGSLFQEKIAGLSYYFLEEGKKVSFLAQEKELQEFSKKLIEIIGKIKSCQFDPQPGHFCQFCDFYEICEYRK